MKPKRYHTYEDNPSKGILVESDSSMHPSHHMIKGKRSVQLLFGRDMIISIKQIVYWELIHQFNQTHIEYDTNQ